MLEGRKLAPSTINQHLSAIRALADECAESDLLDQPSAAAIGGLKGVPIRGVRLGKWLSSRVSRPRNFCQHRRTPSWGSEIAPCWAAHRLRLRRDELTNLTFAHLQQREGRWVIIDIVGEGRRVRTVPVPGWAKALIHDWARSAGLTSGVVLRRFRKGGWLVYETNAEGISQARGTSADAIADVVTSYAR